MKIGFFLDLTNLTEAEENYFYYILSFLKSKSNGKFIYGERFDCVNYLTKCLDKNFDTSSLNKYFNEIIPKLQDFDCIITNSPNPLLRKNHPLVLNLFVGIYNRPPFPQYFTIDPLGYYERSLIYNATDYNIPIINSNLPLSTKLISTVEKLLHKEKDNLFDVNLFPFQTETEAYKRQNLSKSQIEYFWSFFKNNKNVFYTKKPDDYVFNKKVVNEEGPKNLQTSCFLNYNSSYIIPKCTKIFTFHSTLGFQAALHNKTIESPSFFNKWKGDQRDTIEMLLNLVWFSTVDEFFERLYNIKTYFFNNRQIKYD